MCSNIHKQIIRDNFLFISFQIQQQKISGQSTYQDDSKQQSEYIQPQEQQDQILQQRKIEYVKFDLKDPYNDNTLIKLSLAQNLFCQELPRMPRDYITRLVFNPYHENILLFERDPQNQHQNPLVGGICYRLFEDVKLIEIAFCAVSGSKKYSGIGSLIMNHLKEHVKAMGYTDIVTYADNSAQDYFAKQGFSKNVSLSDEVWLGRIKHYEGAKFVHCMLYNDVDYVNLNNRLLKRRQKLLDMFQVFQCIGTETDKAMKFLSQQYDITKLSMATQEQVTKSNQIAQLAILYSSKFDYAIPFLYPQENPSDQILIVPNSIQQMLEKCQRRFYRTRAIFCEDSKSIFERCEAENGDANITSWSKKLYEQLIIQYDRYSKLYDNEDFSYKDELNKLLINQI